MSELQKELNELSKDFEHFYGRIDEALKHVATKTDIAELKTTFEERLHAGLTPKQKAALVTAFITSITTAGTAICIALLG